MSLSLPAEPPHTRTLTRVVPQVLGALRGESAWFAPATSAIVFAIDGLGIHNLRARSGHARFLAQSGSRKDVARTVFPSTTASALASLMTGEAPGEHGIVGYSALVPGLGRIVNQLRGWETDGLPPTWQRTATLFAREHDRPKFIVSKVEYAGTGFTAAALGPAEFVGADDLDERVALAADLAAAHPGALVYLYTPELDRIGHRRGWESDVWLNELERVDAATRALATAASPTTGIVVTADHGMIDVPRHRHVLLSEGDVLVDGVRLIGGEPRMLHLYADVGAAARVHAAWVEAESGRSWVMTRDEAIGAGLFGHVADDVRERIGDVLVAARAAVAYYDDRLADKRPQKMVGQHGSLTSEERVVPLIRLGAFA